MWPFYYCFLSKRACRSHKKKNFVFHVEGNANDVHHSIRSMQQCILQKKYRVPCIVIIDYEVLLASINYFQSEINFSSLCGS